MIVDPRIFERQSDELINTGKKFALQFRVGPTLLIVKEVVPVYRPDRVCDVYHIVTNFYVPKKRDAQIPSIEMIDFTQLTKIPKPVPTESIPLGGGIINNHVFVLLRSGYVPLEGEMR